MTLGNGGVSGALENDDDDESWEWVFLEYERLAFTYYTCTKNRFTASKRPYASQLFCHAPSIRSVHPSSAVLADDLSRLAFSHSLPSHV